MKRCEPQVEIRLVVNPGYGASKKVSFVQPDAFGKKSYFFASSVIKIDTQSDFDFWIATFHTLIINYT